MKAVTLIELILSIVIFSLVVVPVLLVFATVSQDTAGGIYINRAQTLASSYMELVLSKSFDENKSSPFTAVSELGPDSGEADIFSYDDVDDFHNYTISDSDYPGFSGKIEVYYIVENVDGSIDWGSKASSPTNYKRIDIKVSHPQLGTLKISNGVTSAGHTSK